jgi:hypothetical protein
MQMAGGVFITLDDPVGEVSQRLSALDAHCWYGLP